MSLYAATSIAVTGERRNPSMHFTRFFYGEPSFLYLLWWPSPAPPAQQASCANVARRSLTPSMSTMEAGAASDVLADLDELDSVMGVETQDQQDLKPKQVRVCLLGQFTV